MSDYSYRDGYGPRLMSYERHDSSPGFSKRISKSTRGQDNSIDLESRTDKAQDCLPQRSLSFQRSDEVVRQFMRRSSNTVAPMSVEVDQPPDIVHDGRHLQLDTVLKEKDYNCSHEKPMHGSCMDHSISEKDYLYGTTSCDTTERYDNLQETDILGDDISEDQSDIYQPGRYHPTDDDGLSSEDDDPEVLELEERNTIIQKYDRGPESKDIDPWENPEFDIYLKMDRFGFVHKDAQDATEEEQMNKRRISKEVKRVNKWLAMEQQWRNGRPKKLEQRIWKGIPEKLRMKIWPRLLGATELQQGKLDVYQELLLRARLVSKDIKQIDLDINRTYRDHLAFRRRYDVKQQSLLNVLAAYSMYNTEVGYCQGMSQIAALFLMYLDEEDTFWCLHALMVGKKHTMHGFFVPGFPKLSRFEEHFKKVLKKYKPRIFKHLEKQGIPYIYLTKWWFGCFLDRVPFSLALRLWDVYILEGDPILIAMALNIMKMHEKTIRKLQMEHFMDFIQSGIAANFEYSDDETIYSLREVLTKLKNDRLHMPLPPRPEDLSEVPTKALGPILSRPMSSIREEQEEIRSRRSHATSVGRSPHLRREKHPKDAITSRTPSISGIKRNAANDSSSSSHRTVDSHSIIRNGRDISFQIPSRHSQRKVITPPPDPLHPSLNDISPNNKQTQNKSYNRFSSKHMSSMRDEHSGRMVTLVRADDEEDDTIVQRLRGRVHHTSNNVTIIMVGDDGDSVV